MVGIEIYVFVKVNFFSNWDIVFFYYGIFNIFDLLVEIRIWFGCFCLK